MPGVIADGTSEYRCPRCRNILRQSERLRIGDDQPPADENPPAVDSPDVDPQDQSSPASYDSWELEQRLKHIERLLAAADRLSEGDAADEKLSGDSARFIRLDSAHGSPRRPHDRPNEGIFFRPGVFMRAVTWSTLLLGVTTLACGGFLMAWSVISNRPALWLTGTPIAIAGAISLFIALVVQIDRLLHDNRDTAAKLDIVDNRLGKLTAATTHLGNHRHAPSDAFYSHFAGGANPQLLLRDLKSQLDLLTEKIDER